MDDEEFIYIDRGCIVNLIHIMQVKEGMAVLKNGASLPISLSHLQDVKDQINAYWGGTHMTERLILLSDIITGSLRIVICFFLILRLLSAKATGKKAPGKELIAAGISGGVLIAVFSYLMHFPEIYRMALESLWIAFCAAKLHLASSCTASHFGALFLPSPGC